MWLVIRLRIEKCVFFVLYMYFCVFFLIINLNFAFYMCVLCNFVIFPQYVKHFCIKNHICYKAEKCPNVFFLFFFLHSNFLKLVCVLFLFVFILSRYSPFSLCLFVLSFHVFCVFLVSVFIKVKKKTQKHTTICCNFVFFLFYPTQHLTFSFLLAASSQLDMARYRPQNGKMCFLCFMYFMCFLQQNQKNIRRI